MKRKTGKGKVAKKRAAKSLTRRDMRVILRTGAIILGAALAVFLVLFFTRPKMLWYVDENYSAAWNRLISEKTPPLGRFEVISRPENDDFPKKRYGFTISRQGPEGESVPGTPVVVYQGLSRSREYEGWRVLAVDPWMVYRMHFNPVPRRSFLNNNNERGSLLLAGADTAALQAWLCQVLQESPGVFTPGEEVWEQKRFLLTRDYPFQSGAFSYSWIQVWPLLTRDERAWLYAPLSQARALPPYRAGQLLSSRFPEPAEWTRFGLHADLLWAKMHGSERQQKKLAAVEQWLNSPDVQTSIANAVSWIPAHQSGIPYNTISSEAREEWLRSSFIWQVK